MTAATAGRSAAGGPPAAAPVPHRGRRQPAARPRWARPALAGLLVLTAVLYTAGLSRSGWANDFYAAAVQAGTRSWKAFFFGSFDASSFITVDKTPASLWVMELSARIFGLNYWSMLVPQAIEGVAAVGLLYAAVRRWSGPAAGLLAGTILALTPVAALMFRFNNPDALLVLLMTAAAYAMVRAVESGRTRWLALAGALLGLGFLTKMLQAFLVLPGFSIAYLLAGPRRLRTRIWQLLVGTAALIGAAGWWVAAVMLTPAADRPYVGGSTNDSILQLTFGYNGLGRLDGSEAGSVGPGPGHGGSPAFSGSAGLGRLFGTDMGSQISWLLPAALLALAALIWLSRRSARPGGPGTEGLETGRIRAVVLLWGGWLLVTGGVFSFMAGIIHPYYTVALAPAIGALTGTGAVALWRCRDRWPARSMLAAGVAGTALWSYVLLGRSPSWHPQLRTAVLACGVASAVLLLAERQLSAAVATARGRHALAAAAAGLALVAALAGPAAYSLDTAATAHAGALPTAGPAVATFGGPGVPGAARRLGSAGGLGGAGGRLGGAGGAGGRLGGAGGAGGRLGGAGGAGQPGARGTAGGLPGARGQIPPGAPGGSVASGGPGTGGGTAGPGGGLGGSTQVSRALAGLLEKGATGYRWAAATVGSESAAPLQLATGEPIMSIGGFNGTDPAPTLAQFKRLVAAHEIHYFVGANAHSFGGGSGSAAQITAWVAAHFTARTVGGETVYDLAQPNAPG